MEQGRSVFDLHCIVNYTCLGQLFSLKRLLKIHVRTGCGLGLSGTLLDEMLHHCLWAKEKCSTFMGRAELIDAALAVIRRVDHNSNERGSNTNIDVDTSSSTPFGGVSLCLVGRSGCGKTALMAKLASCIAEEDDSRPVIVRFCGTSKVM